MDTQNTEVETIEETLPKVVKLYIRSDKLGEITTIGVHGYVIAKNEGKKTPQPPSQATTLTGYRSKANREDILKADAYIDFVWRGVNIGDAEKIFSTVLDTYAGYEITIERILGDTIDTFCDLVINQDSLRLISDPISREVEALTGIECINVDEHILLISKPDTYWNKVNKHHLLIGPKLVFMSGDDKDLYKTISYKDDNYVPISDFTSRLIISDVEVEDLMIRDIMDIYAESNGKLKKSVYINIPFLYNWSVTRLYSKFGKRVFKHTKIDDVDTITVARTYKASKKESNISIIAETPYPLGMLMPRMQTMNIYAAYMKLYKRHVTGEHIKGMEVMDITEKIYDMTNKTPILLVDDKDIVKVKSGAHKVNLFVSGNGPSRMMFKNMMHVDTKVYLVIITLGGDSEYFFGISRISEQLKDVHIFMTTGDTPIVMNMG